MCHTDRYRKYVLKGSRGFLSHLALSPTELGAQRNWELFGCFLPYVHLVHRNQFRKSPGCQKLSVSSWLHRHFFWWSCTTLFSQPTVTHAYTACLPNTFHVNNNSCKVQSCQPEAISCYPFASGEERTYLQPTCKPTRQCCHNALFIQKKVDHNCRPKRRLFCVKTASIIASHHTRTQSRNTGMGNSPERRKTHYPCRDLLSLKQGVEAKTFRKWFKEPWTFRVKNSLAFLSTPFLMDRQGFEPLLDPIMTYVIWVKQLFPVMKDIDSRGGGGMVRCQS